MSALMFLVWAALIALSIAILVKFWDLARDVADLKKIALRESSREYLRRAKESYLRGDINAAKLQLDVAFSAALVEIDELYRGKNADVVKRNRPRAIMTVYEKYEKMYGRLSAPVPLSLNECLEPSKYM